ncbi:TPA: hypothetical protein N0F65_003306, partial [Lagenidium giganteum]
LAPHDNEIARRTLRLCDKSSVESERESPFFSGGEEYDGGLSFATSGVCGHIGQGNEDQQATASPMPASPNLQPPNPAPSTADSTECLMQFPSRRCQILSSFRRWSSVPLTLGQACRSICQATRKGHSRKSHYNRETNRYSASSPVVLRQLGTQRSRRTFERDSVTRLKCSSASCLGASERPNLAYIMEHSKAVPSMKDAHNLLSRIKAAKYAEFPNVTLPGLCQAVTLRTKHMRHMFSQFPEVVLIDATHATNNAN